MDMRLQMFVQLLGAYHIRVAHYCFWRWHIALLFIFVLFFLRCIRQGKRVINIGVFIQQYAHERIVPLGIDGQRHILLVLELYGELFHVAI